MASFVKGVRRSVLSLDKRRSRRHLILTITDGGGGSPLVTTASPHGLDSGTGEITVFVTGTSVAGYNGNNSTITTVSPTKFILNEVGYSADATGGTWVQV